MTKKDPQSSNERLVVAYEAPTQAEALVVRGLLQSAGIYSPDFNAADPFPLKEPPEGVHGAEVWVPESQLKAARRIIAEAAKNRGAGSAE